MCFGCLHSVSLLHGGVGWSTVVRVDNIFQHSVWSLAKHTLHYCKILHEQCLTKHCFFSNLQLQVGLCTIKDCIAMDFERSI